jgi:uncharacterized membrane protein YoaK (UPF0700 family)
MQETNITPEEQKKKDEKKERKRREALALIVICSLILGAILGYTIGRQEGLFDGYQLCLKQFEIIRHVPEMFP